MSGGDQPRVREHGTARVLDTTIDRCSRQSVTAVVDRWCRQQESRVVCFANTHVVTTAVRDRALHAALEGADLVAPDGFPVAWAVRRLGFRTQQRIDGPGWMLHWCGHAAAHGIPIYLYGSTETTLELLERRLIECCPGLVIASTWSPPFRELTEAEQVAAADRIVQSGARVVFVGLGAPRQEQWMHELRRSIPAVLVGVGAAFDFHAGRIERAPVWMRRAGLEWLHRLLSEPRRLWRRYLLGTLRFTGGFGAQLVRHRTRQLVDGRPTRATNRA